MNRILISNFSAVTHTCLDTVGTPVTHSYNHNSSQMPFWFLVNFCACACSAAVVKPGKEHAGETLEIPSEESLNKSIEEA